MSPKKVTNIKIGKSWKKLACCLAAKELRECNEMSLDAQHKKVLELYNRRVEKIFAGDSFGAYEIDPVNTFVDPSDLGSLMKEVSSMMGKPL